MNQLLMIPNGEGCEAKSKGRFCYLGVKKLSMLLREITSNDNGNFYYLNSLHSFKTTKKILNRIKEYAKIKIFCNIFMPSENTEILEFNQCQKFDKLLFMQILNA